MSATGAEKDVAALSRAVARRMGLHFPPRRHADLWKGVDGAAHDLGFEDAVTCARWLSENPLTRKHIEILASHLTIGETYFFREPATLDALRDKVLPGLIAARREVDRRVRIWSAGCCTGEEPYSVAMLLDALIPDLARWDITLLATDINPVFLRRAGEGLYRPWSFRNCPPDQKERYFEPTADVHHRLCDRIRSMVTFEYLNLAEDQYPALLNNTNAMDIILCRNVLIYFDPAVAAGIVTRLGHCLVEGGRLVVAPSEVSLVPAQGFAAERIGQACLYRRDTRRKPRVQRGVDHRRPAQPVFGGRAGGAERPDRARPVPRTRHRPHPGPGKAALLESACRQAEALYDSGRYSEVVRILLPHVKPGARPAAVQQWGAALRIVARAYANQGMLDEAEQWCRQALRSAPDDPGLHYLLATILQEEGHPQEARELLQTTVKLADDFVLAHFALGALSQAEGRPRRAARHLEHAVVLLKKLKPGTLVPESEGIPAGRLIEIIKDQQEGVPAS